MNRRAFLQNIAISTMGSAFVGFPWKAFNDPDVMTITLMHTNDQHSRIEPFPEDGSRNAGRGGAARRAALIKSIRTEAEHTLLLDCGDVFQGTPYFNFFAGELEFKLMSEMGYDAGTIGNHDFDAGIDGLEKQLPNANFPMVISNYDFRNTILQGKTKDHLILQRGEAKIGIFGLGIELKGLVPKELYLETQYLDPIASANAMAARLRHDEKCDVVICLSHLGYRYREDKVSDQVLADYSKDIDIILGGHTHTFLDRPDIRNNRNGEPVVINQVGWAGLLLGKLDIHLEKNKRKKCVTCANRWVV